jgi:hypothetical protein
MRGRVYINAQAPENVTMDFSASPSELATSETCYGFALNKTLEHLGLDSEVGLNPELSGQLIVAGSVDTIRDHTSELQRHIGLIARYSKEQENGYSHDQEWVGRILGRLVQQSIPRLSKDTSLMRAMGVIVEPFADAVCRDGVLIHYARHASAGDDGQKHDTVKAEDGTPLGIFSAKDIGGLLIGPDGLPVKENFGLTARISEADMFQLRLIAWAKESKTSTELRQSLRRLLDKQKPLKVESVPPEEDARKVVASYARTDLEEACSVEFDEAATFADLIRLAVKGYIADSMTDVELQEKVEQQRRKLEQKYASLYGRAEPGKK